MRIDRPESSGTTPGRLAVAWGRARGWFEDLGPPGRVAVLVTLLAGMIAIGAVALPGPEVPRAYLFPEHRFTSEDAQRIVQRLIQQSIDAEAVGGRIEVPAERLAAAYDVVVKAGLEPLSPRQLRDQPPEFHLLLSPDQLARMDLREQERFLEASLRQIDPALSTIVRIRRESPRSLSRRSVVRATVELTLEDGRAIIPDELADRVRNKVTAWLEPDQLTLMDGRGTILLPPDDPSLGHRTRVQAREDALRAELLAALSWIEGVRVAVLIATTENEPRPMAPPSSAEPVVPESPEGEAVIRPNGPIASLDPPVPTAPTPLPPLGKAAVSVLVPSRYYQRVARGATGEADPTTETIQALVEKTEATVRAIVARTIPPDQLDEVTVDRYFQPPPERPAPVSTSGVAWIERLPDWWPAAAGAGLIAGAALVVLAGSRLRHRGAESATRRSARGTGSRLRFDVGVAEDAGPSERARALIRQDPAAAAGVIRRWIGQGGSET